MIKNLLIKAENLYALEFLLHEKNMKEKIDLVYIDPPFATNENFTLSDGRASTISKSKKGELAYSDKIIGKDFINFMKERLLIIKELMSKQGSIYVHTDYKIGHYMKVMMDEVFGINNFRNDITRIKCNPKNFRRIGFGNIKDCILFYTKTNNPIWNEPHYGYTKNEIERLFTKVDSNGRRYTTVPIHAPGESKNAKPFKGLYPPVGRHWRTDVHTLEEWDKQNLIEWSITGNPRKIIYADETEGMRVQDVWKEYKDPLYPSYPTEKNLKMIELIVKTSSNIDSIVLDCFCGSGTTLLAAQNNGRHWIGIDSSNHAIEATRKKMKLYQDATIDSEFEYLNF